MNITEMWSNDAEQAVLGAILMEPALMDDISAILRPSDFHAERHQRIYKALGEMSAKGLGIDALTLAEYMGAGAAAVGGVQYLIQLTQLRATMTSASAEQYARTVREKRLRRGLKAVGERIVLLAQDAGPLDRAISEAEMLLSKVSAAHDSVGLEHIGPIILEHWQELYDNREVSGGGLSTGLRPMDNALGGLHKSDLVILAARPGIGKSALVTQIAYAVARSGGSVGMFSLEMSARQIAERLVAGVARVDTRSLRLRRLKELDWDGIWRVAAQIAPYPIYVDSSAVLTPMTALARARRLRAKHGLDLLIIDYLQLMTADTKHDNRQQEVAEISRLLKGIARDLDVPVLACAQLSRAVEMRKNKEPELSDLRESGSIEQDADVVAFLHRLDTEPGAKTYNTDLLVKKHRHGPVGKCELVFVPDRVMFTALEVRNG